MMKFSLSLRDWPHVFYLKWIFLYVIELLGGGGTESAKQHVSVKDLLHIHLC